MENSLKSIATHYGLYLGALLSFLTVIIYAVNLDLFVNVYYGFSLYFIVIIFGIITVAKVKANYNGFLSFKNAFTSYFITILIGLTISSLVSFVIFNFIDPEAAEILKTKTIDMLANTLEGLNTPVDQIDEMVEKVESQNMFSIGNVFQSLVVNYLIPLCIIGLIVAAALKKSNPEAE
ncbi:DUF4199 domain-containing protein [Pseudotamlana agarivorans]|uniref:DUF4199 domain-containing protein n=1 Tax=Pseudotamlana agarivorans TaxID=481183 RepID=UPI000831B757|nr:DUF4199 domain-containing protein [Tamlana agarivorans]